MELKDIKNNEARNLTEVIVEVLNDNVKEKYQLEIGLYLAPLSEKCHIENFYQPTTNDYRLLQNYLSQAPRPELQYLNAPGTSWRQERIRNFKIFSENKKSEFDIIHFNNNPHDKSCCIVTYISIDQKYNCKLQKLISSLWKVGFSGHLIYRIGGWPYTEEGSIEFFDIPYAFKLFSVLEAKKMGYQYCLWLDACFVALKNIDSFFTEIKDMGVVRWPGEAVTPAQWIQPFTPIAFGVTDENFFQYKAVWAAGLGINFMSEQGNLFLDSWEKLTKNHKLGSLSFTPEQALITIVFGQLNLQSCTTKLPFANSPNDITEETVIFWNHE